MTEGYKKHSLGALRAAEKRKERSPDLIGTIELQRHDIEQLSRQLTQSGAEKVTGNLAGWLNGKGEGKFISVVLTPRPDTQRQKAEANRDKSSLARFFEDEEPEGE